MSSKTFNLHSYLSSIPADARTLVFRSVFFQLQKEEYGRKFKGLTLRSHGFYHIPRIATARQHIIRCAEYNATFNAHYVAGYVLLHRLTNNNPVMKRGGWSYDNLYAMRGDDNQIPVGVLLGWDWRFWGMNGPHYKKLLRMYNVFGISPNYSVTLYHDGTCWLGRKGYQSVQYPQANILYAENKGLILSDKLSAYMLRNQDNSQHS